MNRSFKYSIKSAAVWILWILCCKASGKENLSVCKALNAFGRYGYFSVSMKVFPRSDPEPWLFREPVIDILQDKCELTRCHNDEKATFHGDFHMEFCDNAEHVMEAYFRDFSIEFMDKPWRAFAAGWSDATIARALGIDVNYIRNSYSYVFVRIQRKWDCENIKDMYNLENAEILPYVSAYAESVQVGNKTSVDGFIKKYGSHFIYSYTTGNSLYQVFVYHTAVYKRVKSTLERFGISSLGKEAINAIFSPWYTEHIGSIISASGNTTVMNWANTVLASPSRYRPFSSLLKVYGNSKVLKELDYLLQDEALLSLELKTLAFVFKNPEKRSWFLEVLINHIRLWEFNM